MAITGLNSTSVENEVACASKEEIYVLLETFFKDMPTNGYTESEIQLTSQSRQAFIASENDQYMYKRLARAVNGEIC